ncbi:gluconate 2-dehydrogenase subunit 3 family protein [Ulvibacterium sp.]|uniref:gluconate 2-dehydrogenase subunit 3 family protein n=1 Tax=Ulvibacterium sp. TaxID=2665914 RepID=UPI003BAD6ABE
MLRKTFINRMALGSGGTLLLPAAGLLQGCEYRPTLRTALTDADIPLLDELGNTIIPDTASSPGARAAKIGEYMLLMYEDCMPQEEQTIFLDGINELDSRAAKTFSCSFVQADPSQKLKLLEVVQDEALTYNLKRENEEESKPHYFDLLKGLTISGYFSSEIGMTQARNYLPLPGKFEACMPYDRDDKPWAT